MFTKEDIDELNKILEASKAIDLAIKPLRVHEPAQRLSKLPNQKEIDAWVRYSIENYSMRVLENAHQ